MGRKKKGLPVHGWVNLNKPKGLSSSKAVSIVKRAYNAQKAGHAGTLDPLADGILPIALGEATKTVPYIQDSIKTYAFSIIWGEQRSTDDAEGEVIQSSDHRPSEDEVLSALPSFIGEIEQIPPIYSAIKLDGKRAYDLARYGKEPSLMDMPKRNVYVESLELIEHGEEETKLICVCGKGTYIRSIARDLALQCSTFGYVGALQRQAVGCFSMDDAISLDFFEQSDHSAELESALLDVDIVLDDIPELMVTQEEAIRLRHGQRLSFVTRHDYDRLVQSEIDPKPGHPKDVLIISEGQPLGLVTVDGAVIKPERLFNL
jgi:tRNA pseudouridine55 synthase